MTSEPVISGSISVLHVFKIFFPSLCIRLQQSDESFQIAVQILRCNNQHDHHQKAPKHKEKGKDGLTDPEDLTPLDLKDNQLARVYRGTVEDRVKRWVVSARVAVVIEASCFVVPAKFAQPITGAVHEVEGGEVDDEDEAGQQGEAQENSHLALQANLELHHLADHLVRV